MKKSIIISLITIALGCLITLLILFFTNYGYKCTRFNVTDEEIFYLNFNIFGKFKNLKYENILYFDTKEEAKKYFDEQSKNFSSEEISYKGKTVTFYSDDYYMTYDEVKNRKVAKKTYEGNGYKCEKIK